MATFTRAQLFLIATAIAEDNTPDALAAARKTAIQNIIAGGKRVTQWTDIGLSASTQYDVPATDLAALLALAIKIKSGALNPAAATSSKLIYFAG